MKPSVPEPHKLFALRTILTVTTGRLLTKSKGDRNNGISDLYEILEWMTGESPFTHLLPRFGQECAPYLLKWYPPFAKFNTEEAKTLFDGIRKTLDPEEAILWWLQTIIGATGEEMYPVGKITCHESVDPIEELEGMIGAEKVIVICADGEVK